MSTERYVLTFLVPLEARDRVVDGLMGDEEISGFTVTDGQGFSREHGSYDVEEQIAGFRHVCRFEILGDEATLRSLRDRLEESGELSSTAARWLLPVVD